MKYAIAINRAGMLVDALSCDHASSRQLKLTCPFCHQAILWRQGYQRRAPGQEQGDEPRITVEAAFAHYPGFDGDACELRAASREGRADLKNLKIQSRGQRLEMYNRDLWDILLQSMAEPTLPVQRQPLNVATVKTLAEHVKAVRLEMGKPYVETTTKSVATLLKGIGTSDMNLRIEVVLADKKHMPSSYAKALTTVDRSLHLTLCKEIADFIVTKTAHWTLSRLVAAALGQYMVKAFDHGVPKERLKAFAKAEIKPEYLAADCLTAIVCTPWVKIISEHLT